MSIIKIERLKDGTGVRAFQEPHKFPQTVPYKDLLKAYFDGVEITEAHSHLAVEAMNNLKKDDEFLEKACIKHFKDAEVVKVIPSMVDKVRLSFEIKENSKKQLSITGHAKTDSGNKEFDVSVDQVLDYVNERSEEMPLTVEEFLSSGPNYQTAFIIGYLEGQGQI